MVGRKRRTFGSHRCLYCDHSFFIQAAGIFKPSAPPPSAKEIAQTVIAMQSDKKVEVLTEQVGQLILAVEELKNKQAEPDAPAGIDSALKELEKGHTTKAENIFRRILQDKVKEGEKANKEAAQAARHLGALAFFHDTKGSLDAYQQAVELDTGNSDGWNRLGHLQSRSGNLDAALQSYNQVLRIGEAEGKKELLAIAYGNLGIIYKTRGDLDKAEEYYRKSLAIEKELGRKGGMASDYGNLGNIYQIRGDLDKAEEYHIKSLAIHEALGRKEGMASDYGNLGIIYKTRGDLGKAEEYYRKSLAINEALDKKEGIASQYGNLGVIYETRGDLDKAREAWEKSKSLFLAIGADPMVKKIQGWIDSL